MNTRKSSKNIPTNKLIPLRTTLSKKKLTLLRHSHNTYLDTLTICVHTKPEICHSLWEKFSPNTSVYQIWELRYTWHQLVRCSLYFITLYDGSEVVGVMPLIFNREFKRYEIFGCIGTEDNTFFVSDDKLIDILLVLLPRRTILSSFILPDSFTTNHPLFIFKNDYPKYKKRITNFETIDDYLRTLTQKHRYSFTYSYKKTMALNPKITVSDSVLFEDLKPLFKIHKKRFNGIDKVESVFYDRNVVLFFKRFLPQVPKIPNLTFKLFTVFIKGKVAGMCFIYLYKKSCYVGNSAADYTHYPFVTRFLDYLSIEDSIKEHCDNFDFGQIDYGYKHRYFDPEPRFTYSVLFKEDIDYALI